MAPFRKMWVETHRDSEAICSGTHDGANASTYLRKIGADFKSCGISIGSVVYNDTDSSHGPITAVTENTVTATLAGGTNNYWNIGDSFSIYATSEKDSIISKIYTDKRYGRKVTRQDEINKGLFPEDVDLDEYQDHIFGPGQPEKGA